MRFPVICIFHAISRIRTLSQLRYYGIRKRQSSCSWPSAKNLPWNSFLDTITNLRITNWTLQVYCSTGTVDNLPAQSKKISKRLNNTSYGQTTTWELFTWTGSIDFSSQAHALEKLTSQMQLNAASFTTISFAGQQPWLKLLEKPLFQEQLILQNKRTINRVLLFRSEIKADAVRTRRDASLYAVQGRRLSSLSLHLPGECPAAATLYHRKGKINK